MGADQEMHNAQRCQNNSQPPSFQEKAPTNGMIFKYKARLNAHGGIQCWGVDYYETYTPVVNWINVWALMALSIIHKLESMNQIWELTAVE